MINGELLKRLLKGQCTQNINSVIIYSPDILQQKLLQAWNNSRVS